MSSGGRRGVDVSGVGVARGREGVAGQGMRIQNASDVTYQTKVQLLYTTNNAMSEGSNSAWTGRNAFQSHTPNGNGFVREFLNGWRECDCSGGIPQMTNGKITSFS